MEKTEELEIIWIPEEDGTPIRWNSNVTPILLILLKISTRLALALAVYLHHPFGVLTFAVRGHARALRDAPTPGRRVCVFIIWCNGMANGVLHTYTASLAPTLRWKWCGGSECTIG